MSPDTQETDRSAARALLYEALVDTIEDRAVVTLGRDGRIATWNAGAERVFGFRSEEAIGRGFECLISSEAVDQGGFQMLAQAAETGRVEIEGWRVDQGGSVFLAKTVITPICGPDGEPSAFACVSSDITERQHSVEKMARSEARYRSLVEHASYGICQTSADGQFIMVNQALVDMLGYTSAEELIDVTVARHVYRDPAQLEALTSRLRESGRVERLEVQWARKDGSDLAVSVSGHAIRDVHLGPGGFELIVEDVSERHKLEQQLRQAQKMEAIGQLAGGVAHDFNNLITAILGYSDLLLTDLVHPERRREDVAEIQKAAGRAADLTRQLLAFSRKQITQPVVLNLNVVVASMDKMLRRVISENIELVTRLYQGLDNVLVDPGQVEQILMNLAVNARDAMPHGGRLLIETSNAQLDGAWCNYGFSPKPGRYVMMAVTDTGIGMNAQTRQHIFEPFFTTKERGHGTGLGLATVYGIVKQNAGYVWVYSEPGKGATFKVYLPALAQDSPLTIDQVDQSTQLSNGSETILLVEDEAGVRNLAREVLSRQGYRVLAAANGREALRRAEKYHGPIHLLLTDMVMPGMGGPDLLAELSVSHQQLKCLYTSGYAAGLVIDSTGLDPATPFLQKPFTPQALLASVRSVLDSED